MLPSDERAQAQANRGRLGSKAEQKAAETETARLAAIHAQGIDRFKLVCEADKKQRDRELEDLKFDRALLEDQWDTAEINARKGYIDPVTFVQVPAKPTVVVNKLDQPVQQVINEARQARLSIIIKAKGEKSSKKGAELRQGLIRAIEVDSGAEQARMWALERAVKCGRGYYRITTDYANDGDHDLDIVIERIKNQGSVYLDPYAIRPDSADMEFAFLSDQIPKNEYRRRWSESKLAKMLSDPSSADDLTSVTDRPAPWMDQESVRIAEYWYIEHKKRVLVTDMTQKMPDGSDLYKKYEDELPPSVKLSDRARKRDIDIRKVKRVVMNGAEIIEEATWPGRYIPIIPVYGKEYVVDSDTTYKGIISNAKDAQRIFNMEVCAELEMVNTGTRSPWIIDPKQVEGYEHTWQMANVKNYSYLPFNRYVKGVDYGPPIRNVAEPAIQAIGIAIMRAEANIKAMTARYDPSLGLDRGDLSGKAIKELKVQGETSTSNYLENLASVSMLHEARILLDLMPFIYDREGRIVRLLGEEPKDERQVILGQPFTKGPDGTPVPVPQQQPGLPPGLAGRVTLPPGAPPQPEPEHYDLHDGAEYASQVSVGKSFATQRDANAGLIETLIKAVPEIAPQVLDIWAENLDGPMATKLSERIRKLNPNLKDDGDLGIPPAVQAQMQAMQQQLQALQQQLQQAQFALQTDKVKSDAQIKIKSMELQLEERLGFERLRTDVAKTKATLDSKEAIAHLNAEEDRLSTLIEHAHDVAHERVKGAESRQELALDHALTSLQPKPEVAGAKPAKKKPAAKKPKAAIPAPKRFQPPAPEVPVGPTGIVDDPRG